MTTSHLLEIGHFKCAAIDTGIQRLDGGAMFGVVPKTLWSQLIPADEKNRIPLALRCLYLESNDRRVLIDCGIGEKFNGKMNTIYGIENTPGGITQALINKGIDPLTITDVILTHLHFDHAGGATSYCEHTQQYVPTFKHATYHLQKNALAHAQNPNPKDKASFRTQDWQPLLAHGVLNLIDGPHMLFEDIQLIVSNGHTDGQQLVLVHTGHTPILYCGDAIPTASHLAVPYVMGYDLHPVLMMQEKEALLKQASQEKWILFYEHDPVIAASHITEEQGRYLKGQEIKF